MSMLSVRHVLPEGPSGRLASDPDELCKACSHSAILFLGNHIVQAVTTDD